MHRLLKDESATLDLSARFAKLLAEKGSKHFIIYLSGDLGAGKTCFARGFLRGLEYKDRVKSPTFTVVEPYELTGLSVYHLDLYRVSDPEELEYLGLRDFLDESSGKNVILLIEWPERGKECLPQPDIEILLQYVNNNAQEGRQITLNAISQVAIEVINSLD